jgi:cytochrome c oxidase subunit 2
MNRLGDTRDEYIELLNVYWPIGVGVFLLIVLAVLFVLWRYRASRVKVDWPTGKDESHLEEAWAVLLACVVAALLYFTYNTMSDERNASAKEAGEVIEVTAARWNWRFHYPRYGVTRQGHARRVPTLTVPADTPILFRETSLDVIHSFWIPHERFKWDAFPGRTTTFTLRFDKEDIGMHPSWGECAQFCGLDHSYMGFNVEVMSQADFARWAKQNGKQA